MITVRQTTKLTAFDEQTFNNLSQMIKAALPYLNVSSARPMAILARFMELRSTLQYFNSPGKLQACSIGSRHPSPEEMLSDLRKYCDGNEAKTIDQLLNALKIGHFYEKVRTMESNPDFNRIMNTINSGGSHNSSSEFRGGDPMSQSFNPEQLFKNIPPDVLKNFNPEMLKNFDVNKFNQLMQTLNANTPTRPGPSGTKQNEQFYNEAVNYKTDNSVNEAQLKALLTPEQLRLFESLRKSMT